MTHPGVPDRGGIEHTLSGKWLVSVSVRTEEHESNPYYIGQFPNLINYHPQTLRYQQLVFLTFI